MDRQQSSHPVESGDVVSQQLPQRQDEQVSQGVVIELPVPLKPVLEHVPPGQPPLGVLAQGGQRHPQVPRRQAVELPTQTPRGPAVIGDGDDGGEPVSDVPQRPERGGQAVPAPQGHDGGPLLASAGPPGYIDRRSHWLLPSQVTVLDNNLEARSTQPGSEPLR